MASNQVVNQQSHDIDRKSTLMILSVILSFVISMIPEIALNVAGILHDPDLDTTDRITTDLQLVVYVGLCFKSSTNYIICFLSDQDFRATLLSNLFKVGRVIKKICHC